MAQRVRYPAHIEPLVQFVEDTTPDRIVAATHDKLAAGTSVKDMLLASALAVVRSSDLPPGHHGGPLHPLAGLHAVRHIAARLPGRVRHAAGHPERRRREQAHPLAGHGPLHPGRRRPVSENDDVDATVKAFRMAVSRGVYNACDHYFLYLLERLSPMQVLEHLLEVGIAKNQLDDHYFLFPVFTWRALEYFGWEYAKYIGRAPVRYITRPTAPATLADVDDLIRKHELLERDLRVLTGEDETAAVTALADEIGRAERLRRDPGDAGARARRRRVARGGGRGALGGRLDALPPLADGQPDGRAHQYRRQHAAIPAAPARAVPPHQAAGAARLAHGTGGAHGAAHAGSGRPARARARRVPAVPHAGRAAGGDREPSSAASRSASGCPRAISPRGAPPTRSSRSPRWPSSTPISATRPSP